MALSIGELVGYVSLDTEAAEKGMDAVESRMGEAKGKWSLLLGGAGIAAAGAFAGSLVGAMNLEPGRDKIAASLGLTEKQAAVAGKVAGDVYANGWGESADEVNTAVEAVMSSIKGMRHASAGDLQSLTQDAMAFAQAMGVEVGKAAQVAGNMIQNGMAKDGTEAFDLLTKASQKVPAELRGDILDATDEYGQFFHSLGIKGPEAMALLANGAKKGMYGIDKAGDAIKEFTIRATDGSKNTSLAFESLGLPFHKVTNDLLAGGDRAHKAFGKIIDGLLAIKDPSKRAQTSLALFGTPMEDLGTKDIPKFLRSLKDGGKGLGDFHGATKKAGDTLSDNARNNIETFKRKVQTGFVNLIGQKVLPVVTEWTGKLNTGLGPAVAFVGDTVRKVTGWLQKHSTTSKILLGIIAALTVVTAAHAAVMAVSAAGGMAAWLKSTRLISAATKVWAAVQWALNIAMDANPIGLIVLAIVALVAAFVIAYKKSETFRNIVQGALHGVVRAGKAVGHFFTDTLPQFFRDAWNKVKELTTRGAGKVVGFVKGIPGKIKSGLGHLVRMFTAPWREAGLAAYNIIRDKGGAVVDWIKGIPGKIMGLAGKFASAGKNLLQGFIDGMKNAAGIISGIAGNVWNSVKGLLNGAIDKINAALSFTIKLPGPDLHVDLPDIPHLRTGGRVGANTPQMAWIGDANEPETVLRDSQLRVLLETAVAAATRNAQPRQDGRGAPLIGAVYQSPGESADALAERLWFKTRKRG